MPKWCDTTIISRKVWTEGLFTLKIGGSDVQEFKAGQFLHLALNGEEDKIINRPYSVASPHGDELEFFIVLVEDGELTPRLWALNEGDAIKVSERAAGSFTLAKSPDAECLWLMATGTGLAPYIAMLRTAEPWERYKKIVVVHGVRYHADLAYTDELLSFEQKHAGRFKLIQSLTREDTEDTMSGRIPSLLMDGSLEHAAGCELRVDNSTRSHTQACGETSREPSRGGPTPDD